MMRRLKRIGASDADLLDTYIKQVKSILELAAIVWPQHSLPMIEIKLNESKSLHLPSSLENLTEATGMH